MPAVDLHPSRQELEEFALGRLDDDAHAAVEEHVDSCSACQLIVDQVPGDSLVTLLRSTASVSDTIKALDGSETLSDQPAAAAPVAGSRTGAWEPTEGGPADVPAVLAAHPRYEPTRLLGSGGMGTVWLAQHRVMGRQVAVKVIRPEFVAKPGAAERFHREAQAAARLHHPNIVAAFDAEQAGGIHLLAMEYVDGVNLADLLRERGPLPVAEASDAVRQAALGLQHAFECGLIHRDLKPHNLMRTADGTVKILDFGLAVLADANRGEGGLTAENVVLGTPDYIAPEQAEDSRAADIRSDIYSLGCTLYHLLTGRVPFPGDSVLKKLDGHRTLQPESIRNIRPEVPAELAEVVMRMMAKQPADRFQTPAAVAAALAPFAAGTIPVAVPPRKKRPRRQRWYDVVLPVLGGLLMVAFVIYRVQTDNGTIEIHTEDEDVKIIAERNGKQVTVLDPKTKQTWVVDTGEWTLRLDGDPEGLKIEMPDTFKLKRGERQVVTVKRVAKVGAAKAGWPRAFSPPQSTITRDGVTADQAGWRIDAKEARTVRLFELPDPGVEDGVLTYRAKIKSEKLQGNAYLEMWCRLPGEGESFSKGLLNDVTGTTDWASYERIFFLKRGQTPDLLKLNVVLEGKGTLWIKDVQVNFKASVPQAPAENVRELQQPARPKAERINGVDISPDGTYYLVAYQNPDSVYVYDRGSDKVLHRLQGRLGRFTPDGKRVVTVDPDTCTIRMYELESGKVVLHIHDKKVLLSLDDKGLNTILNFQLSGDGSRVLYEYRGSLLVQDLDTAKVRLHVRKQEGAAVFLTRDGKFVLQSGPKPPLQVFDVETGNEVPPSSQVQGLSHVLGLSGDGRRLVRRDGDKLRVHDVSSGKEVNTGFLVGEGGFGQLNPDGQLLMATSGDFREVQLWFIQAGGIWERREPAQKFDPKQVRIAFSADNRFAVVAVSPETVFLIAVPPQLQKLPADLGNP